MQVAHNILIIISLYCFTIIIVFVFYLFIVCGFTNLRFYGITTLSFLSFGFHNSYFFLSFYDLKYIATSVFIYLFMVSKILFLNFLRVSQFFFYLYMIFKNLFMVSIFVIFFSFTIPSFLTHTLTRAPRSGTSGMGSSKLKMHSFSLWVGLSMLTCFMRRAMFSESTLLERLQNKHQLIDAHNKRVHTEKKYYFLYKVKKIIVRHFWFIFN